MFAWFNDGRGRLTSYYVSEILGFTLSQDLYTEVMPERATRG